MLRAPTAAPLRTSPSSPTDPWASAPVGIFCLFIFLFNDFIYPGKALACTNLQDIVHATRYCVYCGRHGGGGGSK